MSKELVLIFDEELAVPQADSIRASMIVCASDKARRRLSEMGLQCRTMAEYSQDAAGDQQRALSWIQKWPDMPVLDGKSFKELLVYNGVSIYWFLQTRFYMHRMKELLVLTERIGAVIAAEKPDSTRVIGNPDAEYVASQLQGMKGSADKARGGIAYKSYGGHPTLKLAILKIFRGTFGRSTNAAKGSPGGKILVVTEASNWRRDFDFETGRYVERDAYFHGIVSQLSQMGHGVTVIDFENRPKRLLNAYSDNARRQKGFGVPVKPWERYVNFDIIRKSRSASRHALKLLARLQNSKEFIESLTYSGVPLYDVVKSDFEDLFKSLKAYAAVTFIDAAERIVEIEKPAAVIMHDEYGALQLAMISAARKKGIPTVSLQHGLISGEQIAYVHERSHISGERPELLFPIPDRMCVWGEGAHRHLIEVANFPPSVPIITGDPKIDFLEQALRSFDRRSIAAKLGISEGKKIIVFATENLPSAEKELLAKAVFTAAREIPECFLVVKVHPNEEDDQFYRQLAGAYSLASFSVLRHANLYELLYMADLVIVAFSTVGAEAMRMGKPVISLNLTQLHDSVPFIKNNVATVVRDAESLLPAIRKCLDGQDAYAAKKAIEFVEWELGKVDGRATERIVRVALESLKPD